MNIHLDGYCSLRSVTCARAAARAPFVRSLPAGRGAVPLALPRPLGGCSYVARTPFVLQRGEGGGVFSGFYFSPRCSVDRLMTTFQLEFENLSSTQLIKLPLKLCLNIKDCNLIYV